MAAVELSPGAIFAADFEVVRRLGVGGMGAVYVVVQRSTGRQRALKLMLPGTVDRPDLRAKFELEARVGARIKSDHVVEVVAAGVDEATGAPWLAMELLEGEDLSESMKRTGALAPRDAFDVIEQVCHALAAAHDVNVVHRDLKPENVFLATSRRTTTARTVKVLDFGIAKLVEEARATNTGAVGTPFWMAPEQTERNAKIGPQADVWAIGLLTYFLLTGKRFWLSAETEDVSVHAFLRELLFEAIPPASARASEQGGAALPPGFDGWLARCLARDPEERFANARVALVALAPVLGVEYTEGAPSIPSGGATSSPRAPSGSAPGSAGAALAHARTVEADVTDEELVGPASGLPARSSRGLFVAGALAVVILGGGAALALRSGPKAKATTALSASATGARALVCAKGMREVPGARVHLAEPVGSGARDEDVGDLCVDTTEVSVDEYAGCVESGKCATPVAEASFPGITPEDRTRLAPYCNWGRNGHADHPMNCLTQDEARAYCAWAHKRLPTEPEWARAARGDDARPYPWGTDPPTGTRVNACDVACAVKRSGGPLLGAGIAFDDGFASTSPVGALTQGVNAFGLFDVAGNVAEWTDSRYCPIASPSCGGESVVVRGGSWMSDGIQALRTDAREKVAPSTRSPDVGFRCVR